MLQACAQAAARPAAHAPLKIVGRDRSFLQVKLPDLGLLGQCSTLAHLIVQESGWRSQQLRVDAPLVFTTLPSLQTLTVTCRYSGATKASWERCSTSQLQQQVPRGGSSGGIAGGSRGSAGAGAQRPSTQLSGLSPAQLIAMTLGRAPKVAQGVSPCVTRHLRCQVTQNQALGAQLQIALAYVDPSAVQVRARDRVAAAASKGWACPAARSQCERRQTSPSPASPPKRVCTRVR